MLLIQSYFQFETYMITLPMRSDLNQNTTLPYLVDQASWMVDVFNMGYKQI